MSRDTSSKKCECFSVIPARCKPPLHQTSIAPLSLETPFIPASIEISEIVRLLHEYEQLSQDGKDCGPTLAILAGETGIPHLEQWLRSELLEKRRDVRDVAVWLIPDPPPPAMPLERRIFWGAIVGTVVGLSGFVLVVVIAGCLSPVRFWDGAPSALFGVISMFCQYGLPIGLPVLTVSCIVGIIIGGMTHRRR